MNDIEIRKILLEKPEGFSGYNTYTKEYCNIDHEIVSIEQLKKQLEVKEMASRYKYYIAEFEHDLQKISRFDDAIELLQTIYTILLMEQAQSRHPLNKYTTKIQKFLEGEHHRDTRV